MERIKGEIDLNDLDPNQRQSVQAMLQGCLDAFSQGDNDIGKASVTAHRIELYDTTPIYQRPRRFPEPIIQQLEQQCKELHLLDIIEPSNSPWSSPIVPVRKKDGTIRLCLDYRRLNSVTKPDRHPLPNLNDAIFGLHGVKYFTSLDLVRGYYQVPLDESSREYTAFSTNRQHYQFKRLCFGLKNAPAAFQRELQAVLSSFSSKKVIIYIDDILIMEDSFEKHLALVQKVLGTLIQHGIKIKPQKCHWFQDQVEFLGHTVSRSGI